MFRWILRVIHALRGPVSSCSSQSNKGQLSPASKKGGGGGGREKNNEEQLALFLFIDVNSNRSQLTETNNMILKN